MTKDLIYILFYPTLDTKPQFISDSLTLPYLSKARI